MTVSEQSKDQARWDELGARILKAIQTNPKKYLVQESPYAAWAAHEEIMALLGPLQGKNALELGCANGRFSIYLAKQGAQVTGIDIGPHLVMAAEAAAELNEVHCSFQQGNITALPFESGSYDLVVGVAILHHLSTVDVSAAIAEAYRVLKPGGFALFYEPVENSPTFNFLQNLFPAGKKGSGYYRPSILRRKAWKEYVKSLDDRDMTNRELSDAGQAHFSYVKLRPFGLLIRLDRLVGNKYRGILKSIDGFLFNTFPFLQRYCQSVLAEYRK